jgi:hypothetical protein
LFSEKAFDRTFPECFRIRNQQALEWLNELGDLDESIKATADYNFVPHAFSSLLDGLRAQVYNQKFSLCQVKSRNAIAGLSGKNSFLLLHPE